MTVALNELLDYTDEERAKWQNWFSAHGNEPLKISLSNETHSTVGALILHCFWAELFYAYWLRGEPFTRESEIVKQNMITPNDDAEPLFKFGQLAREAMRSFTNAASEEGWERTHKTEAGLFDWKVRPEN